MATAYSTLLGLALPVQGELSGTWGDMVDNGITKYVDIAVAGTVTLTNDGAVTLSLTNGDSSATNIVSSLTGAGTVSAQFAIIKVTGTLTTAKVLTPPSSSRTYVVVNAATGSTVTVKASGQTGVSIAVGETAFVYFNGTDYVKVTGTATAGAAGGSNTQVQFNSSGSLAGDADLTFDGTTLSTAGLTASGTVTLSGGTANGVTYLNGSKVLTSGSALTFDGTNLGVGGAATSFGAGYSVSQVTGASGGYQLQSSGTVVSQVGADSGYAGVRFGTRSAHPIIFTYNDSEQMRLTSTGLGIGTSSPGAKLEAKVALVSSANAIFSNGQNGQTLTLANTYNYNSDGGGSAVVSSGALLLRANSNNLLLDSAGNLGLGVTPSASTLPTIQSAYGITIGNNEAHTTKNAYYNSGWKYATTTTAARFSVGEGGSDFRFYTAPSGTAGTAISFTQAMTLFASGGFSLGGTGDPGNGGMSVVGTGYTYVNPRSASGFGSSINFTEAGVSDRYLIGCPASTNDLVFRSNAGSFSTGAERMRLTGGGGLAIGTTADPGAGAIYATGNITAYYSDDRLKTRLGNIENALDKVDQLQGFYYEANETAQALGYKVKREVGVSAQSVQAVLPEIVSPAPIDQQYLTVDYERLVPLLIEAVKELTAKVKALEAK